MGFNAIDTLFFLTFLVIVSVGYIGGTIRLLLVLIAVYLGLILSGSFYVPTGYWLAAHLMALNIYTAQIVSFFLISSLGTAALTVSLFKTFHSVSLPRFLSSMDQVAGAALGALVATFAIFILTAILRAIFDALLIGAQMGVQIWPALLDLAVQVRVSFLANLFADLSTPILVTMLPWFPQGLPDILVL